MLGKLLSDSGGAQRISMTLVKKFGEKNIQWPVVTASFIIGIALFFEVGLVSFSYTHLTRLTNREV